MRKLNKKAFTIVEMLVAIGLLAAMMAASVVVFRLSIDAQQKAAATGDYMRSIRTITKQVENDFSSIDLNAPFALWFEKNGSDKAFFFANGHFEQLTGDNLTAGSDASNFGSLHFVASDDYLLREFTPCLRYQEIIAPSVVADNERNSLLDKLTATLTYDSQLISTFDLLLDDQTSVFKVQMLYETQYGTVRWYPEDNPYPQLAGDSDFTLMGDSFGVFFNIPATSNSGFYPPQELEIKLIEPDGTLGGKINFPAGFKPKALKFTIVISDRHQRLEPKTFTYMVEL